MQNNIRSIPSVKDDRDFYFPEIMDNILSVLAFCYYSLIQLIQACRAYNA